MSPLDRRLHAQLDAHRRDGLLRAPPTIERREGVRYLLNGHPVVGFCSNDYLGLANHPSFADIATPSSGSTAARLVCGDLPEHRRVEARLAELADAEDAVLFPSGFQLNVGVLPALIDRADHVASDRLNHASLIDGLRLSRATVAILPHRQAPAVRSSESPALSWWVTEALFSMDGDHLDLGAVTSFMAAGGTTYIDEAHSFGLHARDVGPCGYTTRHGLRPTVLVGTLGKAFGCAGAFVASSTTACRWIRSTARSFVFSTGPSPALTLHIERAIELASGPEGTTRRARLRDNIERFRHAMNLPELPAPSPIIPIRVGPNDLALSLSAALLERGWHIQAIRPPTVPPGTARLRVTISAAHEPSQIDTLARDLLDLLAANQLDPAAPF